MRYRSNVRFLACLDQDFSRDRVVIRGQECGIEINNDLDQVSELREHVVVQSTGKDRLDVTGARWSLAGAEAVLLLRAVITNDDFHQYWQFHVQQDHQRTHAHRYQEQFTLAA